MSTQYLDFCATTPVDPRVLEVMMDIYANHPGNADSRTHIFGTDAKGIVLRSRKTLAEILNIDPNEIIFTSGATESDNTAILGLREFAEQTGRKHLITTAIEHKAVLQPMKFLAEHGFDVDFVAPDESGRVKAGDVLNKVRKDTLLVSVMHVNNETGVIQPVLEIGEALKNTETYFHVDAAQSFGKLNDDLRKLSYDMLSITAHKIHGPQGIGAVVMKRKNYKRPPVRPMLYGGQQEYGFRPGTTPVAMVAALAKAAEIMDKEYPGMTLGLCAEKERLLKSFEGLVYQINGDPDYTLPNILNISFDGVDSESVFVALKEYYAISSGSACTSGSYDPSYVLVAMGLEPKRISEALRISWWDKKIDIKPLIEYVKSMTALN
ncbi:aminotransferase class V-fold PLP-dependent enzyme [Clostridiales bacterium FE2011]|nr:aminotransferase class V-fold PLP-dependent enzyme [Clostridiales bacterium FE2011]